MDKAKLRPIYSELQGYLTQAPEIKGTWDAISTANIWTHYNETVQLLIKLTNKNEYQRFLLSPERGSSSDFVRVITYRQKLAGLIAALHGEYFFDEPAPFSGMPHTVITQTQHQNQTVFIQMIFEFQDMIEKRISKFNDGSKEKTFLEKLKGSLRHVTDISKLIIDFTKIARECGLSTEDLSHIFS